MSSQSENLLDADGPSPFDVNNESQYRLWREQKLINYPKDHDKKIIQIEDAANLSTVERENLLHCISKTNMAIYQCANSEQNKALMQSLYKQLGLNRLDKNICADDDGISALHVVPKGQSSEYIPYSNLPINWHTDGYYNTPERTIRGMVLHCVSAAAEGGENTLLDPELVYIWLRDENPDYIQALMQQDAMLIPANEQNGETIRAAQSGPVFSIDKSTASLHMRYTARTRSIEWKQDELTQKAVQFLSDIFASNTPYIYKHRMEAGQGVLSNNVLHTRTRFKDDQHNGHVRMVYRARFYDRMNINAVKNDG